MVGIFHISDEKFSRKVIKPAAEKYALQEMRKLNGKAYNAELIPFVRL